MAVDGEVRALAFDERGARLAIATPTSVYVRQLVDGATRRVATSLDDVRALALVDDAVVVETARGRVVLDAAGAAGAARGCPATTAVRATITSAQLRYAACVAADHVVVHDREADRLVAAIPGQATAVDFAPAGDRVTLLFDDLVIVLALPGGERLAARPAEGRAHMVAGPGLVATWTDDDAWFWRPEADVVSQRRLPFAPAFAVASDTEVVMVGAAGQLQTVRPGADSAGVTHFAAAVGGPARGAARAGRGGAVLIGHAGAVTRYDPRAGRLVSVAHPGTVTASTRDGAIVDADPARGDRHRAHAAMVERAQLDRGAHRPGQGAGIGADRRRGDVEGPIVGRGRHQPREPQRHDRAGAQRDDVTVAG